MPIIIKGVKLTEEFTRTLKEIIKGVDGFRSPYLANKARETDKGVEIPCGYGKLLAAVRQKYPEADLLPLDQDEARKNCIDRNVSIFTKFKEYNADYLKTSKNVIITVTSAPGEFMDPEKVVAFLTKTLSKITPAQDHKFKITAKYQVLDAIRGKINAGALKDASGSSVQGRCATMGIRYVEGRPPQRGTKVAVVVQSSEIEKLFAALSADNLFERVPAIRFINPEKRRKHIQELRERVGSAGDGTLGTKNKQRRHQEAKGGVKKPGAKKATGIRVQLADDQKAAKPKKKQGKKVQSQKERLPCLLTIAGIPEALAFDDIKENLDKDEHADILKALAESRLRRPKQPNPSEVSFYCTVENGKILRDAFGNMEINGAELRTTVSDVN